MWIVIKSDIFEAATLSQTTFLLLMVSSKIHFFRL